MKFHVNNMAEIRLTDNPPIRENKIKKFHYGYVIVFCCCLIMGIDVGLSMSCAGIFYQPVSSDLGVPVGEFGLYMSFSYIASTLMLPFAGKLMEKWSARYLLGLNSAVLGGCFFAMGSFNAIWEFYAAGCVIGITLAFLLYLSFPTMVNRWFNTNVGFFIGLCSAASGIGGIVFNPLGAAWITDFGWRTAYWIFGAIVLLGVTPLCLLLLRDYPHQKGLQPFGNKSDEAETGQNTQGIPYSQAVKMPVFYALILFAFLIMASSNLNLFIPNYMTDVSFSLEEASFVAASVMLGVTVGKIVLGLINDRNTLLGVLVTALFGAGGVALLVWLHINVTLVIIGGFFFGWAYAGVTVQTAMLVRKIFGNKSYARIYSNVSIALAAGGALMSGGWGLLADATSFKFIFITGGCMLLVCGLLGVGSILDQNKKGRKRNAQMSPSV